MSKRTGYSTVQIALHWLIALLILGAYLTSDGMGRVWRGRLREGITGIEGNTIHVWIGGAVFALVLIRLIVRFVQKAPEPSEAGPSFLHPLAKWGHWLLYLMMLIVPASGLAAWYGGVRPAGEAHEVLFNVFMLIVLGHALMAIAHQYLWRHGTLMRMLKPEK